MLQSRYDASDARVAELQRRLEDEEHRNQELQLSAGRVKAELQNEITELTGNLKLRAFEAERAVLTYEEVSSSRQQMQVENEQLRQQLDVLKKEYYTLEVQHREGRASERAELSSLREQLRGYVEVERELDAAIRACADGPPSSKSRDAANGEGSPQSVDEALLVGTTLASAPTSSQRRIQQSLLLAQELQRRTREGVQARTSLNEAQSEITRLQEELEAARREVHYSSEPQAYLLEALRRREGEVLALRRDAKAQSSELERARQQIEQATSKRLVVEEDIRKLLAQRQHLDGLRAVLGHKEEASDKIPSAGSGLPDVATAPVSHAERRGRAPSQQPQVTPRPVQPHGNVSVDTTAGSGPGWFQKLRKKLDDAQITPDNT